MRTKDEILQQAGGIITSRQHEGKRELWMEFRKLEVLIDIRDELDDLKKVQIGLYDYQVSG